MSQLLCTSHSVVYVTTAMERVKLLAAVVGEWAVPVMVCSIRNVYGVVVLGKSDAESVEVLAKENDTIMKRHNANITTINDL